MFSIGMRCGWHETTRPASKIGSRYFMEQFCPLTLSVEKALLEKEIISLVGSLRIDLRGRLNFILRIHMKKIVGYVKDYFIEVDKKILLLSTLFVAVFIFVNYHYHLNRKLSSLIIAERYLGWYLVFLIAFSFAYTLLALFRRTSFPGDRNFLT